MAVMVTTGATFAHGLAAPLFDTGVPPHWYAARNLYDVSRDGGFLFMTPIEDDRSAPLTIVVNWASTLRQLSEKTRKVMDTSDLRGLIR